MSKGYSSEDAEERLQRAKAGKDRDADEEAAAQRAIAAASKAVEGSKPKAEGTTKR